MKNIVIRLHKGDDLYNSIKKVCIENDIKAGIIACSVGCVLKAKIRNATGVKKVEIDEKMEIINMNGTVSKDRVHVHISFSKADLSVVGGHLVEGCIVNTTCELVIFELEDYIFEKEFDESTGYNELKTTKIS